MKGSTCITDQYDENNWSNESPYEVSVITQPATEKEEEEEQEKEQEEEEEKEMAYAYSYTLTQSFCHWQHYSIHNDDWNHLCSQGNQWEW